VLAAVKAFLDPLYNVLGYSLSGRRDWIARGLLSE
jgi:hypothetical protein